MSATSAVRVPMPPMKGTGIRKPKSARLGIGLDDVGGAEDPALPGRPTRDARCRAARRPRRESDRHAARAPGARPSRRGSRAPCRSILSRVEECAHCRVGRRRQRIGRAGIEEAAVLEKRPAIGDAARPRRRSWVTKTAVLRSRRCSARNSSLQLAARDRVERAERLVEQEERRVGGQRARDADALALSAGELVRIPARRTRRPGDRPDRAAPRRAPRARAASQPSSSGTMPDVVGDRQMRQAGRSPG